MYTRKDKVEWNGVTGNVVTFEMRYKVCLMSNLKQQIVKQNAKIPSEAQATTYHHSNFF